MYWLLWRNMLGFMRQRSSTSVLIAQAIVSTLWTFFSFLLIINKNFNKKRNLNKILKTKQKAHWHIVWCPLLPAEARSAGHSGHERHDVSHDHICHSHLHVSDDKSM